MYSLNLFLAYTNDLVQGSLEPRATPDVRTRHPPFFLASQARIALKPAIDISFYRLV